MERKSVQASLKLCCALSQLPSRYPYWTRRLCAIAGASTRDARQTIPRPAARPSRCTYANGEKLANFSALITSEVERHEAGETTLQFAIAATHTTGLKSSAVVDANEGFR